VNITLLVMLAVVVVSVALAGTARWYTADQVAIEAPDPGEAPAPSQSVVRVRHLLRSYDLEVERRADVDATRRALHDLRGGAGRHAG